MTVSKFYKRGIIIAEQFNGSDEMVKRFGMHKFGTKDPHWDMQARPYGVTAVRLTDWIVTDVTEKSLRSITNANFQAQMVPLPVIPESVEAYIHRAKRNGINLVTVMSACYKVDKFVRNPDEELMWINQHPDEFAVAWLMIKGAKS